MDPQSSTVYGTERTRAYLAKVLVVIINAMRTSTVVLGTLTLTIIDIALGAVTLGMVLKTNVSIDLGLLQLPISGAFIGTVISLATSAAQIAMWELILSGRVKNRAAGLTVMAILVLLDTVCDVAVVSYLIYGESPLKFLPSHPDLLYFVVAGLMAILTAGNEYLVAGLLEHVRKPTP
jgi:hypothetical protein